ncbi:MAG: Holliday junction branch migration protein RuvA [Bacilli bacterium]|nr:Holliday junction branch migration protein RuvA [Bacilli bacterium]
MYNYIKGKVVEVTSNYIVIDNNNIGYQVYTGNPFEFQEGQEYTVYVYQKIAEDDNSLYGFKTKEQKELFLKLIDVKGLGPKMALPMIALGSVNGIIDAIDRENILYLKKFPKIGDKVARQIILDLKGKLTADSANENDGSVNELIEVLESLGYKKPDIKRVIPQIDPSESLEAQVKSALRLMLK